MRGIATSVALVVCAWAGEATAESWYFDWNCQGRCAEGIPRLTGTDGPYSSEGDCGSAQRARRLEINSEGNAGTATACYTSDSGGGSGGGGGSTPVRPLRVARANLSAIYGGAWTVEYDNGTTADSGPTMGGTIEVTVGREKLGLTFSLGALRASGTAPTASADAEPMWFYDLQFGLASSPFALLRRPGLELRPELGIAILDMGRVSCTRCDPDPANPIGKSEADQGVGYRARIGLDLWLGRRRRSGIALEAMYQRLTMTNDLPLNDPLNGTSAHLTAPTMLFRLSLLRRGADFAAY